MVINAFVALYCFILFQMRSGLLNGPTGFLLKGPSGLQNGLVYGSKRGLWFWIVFIVLQMCSGLLNGPTGFALNGPSGFRNGIV